MDEQSAIDAKSWDSLADRAGTGIALEKPHAAAECCFGPSDLLRPECRALPLLGRAQELAALESWLHGPPPLSIGQLVGRAGIGKTRLAIELCRRADAQGWSAGFGTVETIIRLAAKVERSKQPLLMVVDRPQDSGALSGESWARLRRSVGKLRLLLLDNELNGRSMFGPVLESAAERADVPEPMRLGGLGSPIDRRVLLAGAMALTARLEGRPACPPPPFAALDTAEPLHLLLAALAAPHHAVAAALARSPAELAQELAARDRAKLERFAWQHGLDPALIWHLVASVTLQDGCALGAASSLVRQEAEAMGFYLTHSAEHVADCLADALLGADGEALAPLGPAPIGEAFLISELARHAPDRRSAIIDRAMRRGGIATAATVRRIAALHNGNDSVHPLWAWNGQASA